MYADIVRSTNNQSKYFEQCLLKRSERHYIESQTLQRTYICHHRSHRKLALLFYHLSMTDLSIYHGKIIKQNIDR